MDQTSTPNPQSPSPEGAPTPVPASTTVAAPEPAVKKVLTPEEKKTLRSATFKRLALVLGLAYVVGLLGIFAWALLTSGRDLSIFAYLPVTQNEFSAVLMKIFHIQMGVVVIFLFLYALIGLLKTMLTKKEDIDKKKKASRMSLFGGLGFFFFALAWLAGIWFLGPRLIIKDVYTSPITTVPAVTIGLTSPIEISFDATRVPVDSTSYEILSYTWDFGDGSTSTGISTSHTYSQKAEGDGVYTVTLTVRMRDKLSQEQFEDSYETTVVIANEKTAAYFTASPESGELPLKVQFDATGSYDPDGEIVTYEWDLDGDGSFDDGEGEEIDHTFTQEGDYEVSIRVTDNSGEYNTYSMTIEAGSIGGLRATITTNVGGEGLYYLGEKYKFDGTLSQINEGKITKYTWDFGDGTDPVKTREVEHSFEKAGTYLVTLTVQDAEENTDESTLEIKVIEEGTPPSAAISTTPALVGGVVTGPVPLEVSFDANDSFDKEDDIVEYEWDFDNDGTIDDTGDTASYTYQEEGSFDARLVLTDSVGNTDETTVPIEVTEQGLIARLEITQSNGEVPLTVTFDSSSSSYKEGSIVSYEYNFGDGSASYTGGGSSVTYKYTDVGTFTASVTVIGSDGTRASTSVQIVVRSVALTACFTVNTDSGKAPLFVAVDPSCSEGTIDTYQWDFGDGVISFDRKPETHNYTTAGTYVITLEVTSAEGIVSTFQNEITVR